MQKSKQTYVAPEIVVIDDVYEGAICVYSLNYPNEENPPAARRGYDDTTSGGRYGESTTKIWK